MNDVVVGALIGFVGILLGSLSSEYFRRSSRIEGYSKEIFLRRLQIYEVLYEKVNTAAILANEFEKDEIEDVAGLVSRVHNLVLETAGFFDAKALYINEEIFMHCMLTFMLLPSEGDLEGIQVFRQEHSKEFRDNLRTLRLMIKAETGLSELNRLFRRLSKASPSSDYIEYFRNMKAKIDRSR